jgi:hypothetical protein
MKTVTQNNNVHPSLLENVSIEGIIKLMHFGIWVDSKLKIEANTIEKIMKNELKLYKNDLGIRTDYKA